MIGSQISKARTQKGWTQQQLAEESGISLRTIQRIENDQVKAQFHTIHKLEEILEVSVLDTNENEESVTVVIRWMSVSILLIIVPVIGNLIIPFLILFFKAKSKKAKQLGGSILMFQILWTIGLLICEVIIFNLAEMIWGESNPGNFSPVTLMIAIFWLINLVFVLVVISQSNKGKFKLLERLPSIY